MSDPFAWPLQGCQCGFCLHGPLGRSRCLSCLQRKAPGRVKIGARTRAIPSNAISALQTLRLYEKPDFSAARTNHFRQSESVHRSPEQSRWDVEREPSPTPGKYHIQERRTSRQERPPSLQRRETRIEEPSLAKRRSSPLGYAQGRLHPASLEPVRARGWAPPR